VAESINAASGAVNFVCPELLLAAIVDSSDDAIVSKDLNGTVTSWNRGAERIFGYTAPEMIGRPILHLIPTDRANEEPVILERLRRGERVEHFETVRVCKNGRLIDVSLTISPIRDASGKIVGASKIARDITEQKLAQSRLAQAHEALRRADRMKSEFISTLSHELRTPLNAISGWVQMLEDGASQEEIAEGLEVIDRNVRAQTRLVEDLLDISRIESGKVSLEIQRIDLRSVVLVAMDAVRPAAEGKEVRLTSSFSSVEGAVMGDKNRIQQVVWNLLSNAIKFTPREGRVQIRSERVNSHLEIVVSDTGQGISADFLPHVFDRFRQADQKTSRQHGGMGLGLAICRTIVERYEGSLVLAKSSPQGSIFEITLPAVSAG